MTPQWRTHLHVNLSWREKMAWVSSLEVQPSAPPGALFLISARHLHADTWINNEPAFKATLASRSFSRAWQLQPQRGAGQLSNISTSCQLHLKQRGRWLCLWLDCLCTIMHCAYRGGSFPPTGSDGIFGQTRLEKQGEGDTATLWWFLSPPHLPVTSTQGTAKYSTLQHWS